MQEVVKPKKTRSRKPAKVVQSAAPLPLQPEYKSYLFMASKVLFFGSIFFLTFLFIKKVSTILTPFIISFILAYICAPFTLRLQHKLHVSRNIAAGFVVVVIQAVIILFLAVGLPVLYKQLASFAKIIPVMTDYIENKILPVVPSYITSIYDEINQNIDVEKLLKQSFAAEQGAVVSRAISSGMLAINIVTTLFLCPVLTFYMIRDWSKIHRSILHVIPIKYKEEFEKILHEIRRKVSMYIVGEVYAIFVLSLLYGFGLMFTGLKFGFFIGVLTAVLSIIPYIGFTLCFLAAMVIAFVTNMTYGDVLVISAVFFSIQTLEANYIVPKFVGSKIGLHPLWIIFGLFAGGALLGFIGLLLAIPITTIISVLVKHYIDKYKHSEYYEK